MNRGRHRKQFPYGKRVIFCISFYMESLKKDITRNYHEIFETKEQLNNMITAFKNARFFKITKIQIIYNKKIIKTY